MAGRPAGPAGAVEVAPGSGEETGEGAAGGRLLLVGGHNLFRQALAFLLDRERELEAVAEAGTLAGARRLLAEGVDVAVVDLDLPDGDGTALVEDIREVNPQSAVLALVRTPEDSGRAAGAGAGEVLYKSATIDRIVGAVRAVGPTINQPQKEVC